ncbi:Uu.00g132030.m01.CDS01 [Anthostomella pinea]|uniref:Uu.00g132030.m01.CDS01 n=1 Tax=Anthostomella pinea TaxID=933095 RepID=A0AAI8VIZ1_9PEZI|nr:Uu.00g132030.m01.CDS01 [Anthostomella pinea]
MLLIIKRSKHSSDPSGSDTRVLFSESLVFPMYFGVGGNCVFLDTAAQDSLKVLSTVEQHKKLAERYWTEHNDSRALPSVSQQIRRKQIVRPVSSPPDSDVDNVEHNYHDNSDDED